MKASSNSTFSESLQRCLTAERLGAYLPLRRGGLGYWRKQSEALLGTKADTGSATPAWIETDHPTDFDGEESPFGGSRWTSGTTDLAPEALTALAQGKYIACDIRQEYIHYLKLATTSP